MDRLALALCAILFCIVVVAAKTTSFHQGEAWDHFVFTQQWPQTVCIETKVQHGEHKCVIPRNVTTWSIHGLWPNAGATEGPNNCNSSWPFEEDQILPIRDKLMKYWANLYADTAVASFWEHEWDKHGTCAASLPALKSQLYYFDRVLQLNGVYNITQVFESANVFPGDKCYSYGDVMNILTKAFKQTPQISCAYDKSTRRQYLYAIEICIDQSFNLMHCPKKYSVKRLRRKVHHERYECWQSEQICYPEITPESIFG